MEYFVYRIKPEHEVDWDTAIAEGLCEIVAVIDAEDIDKAIEIAQVNGYDVEDAYGITDHEQFAYANEAVNL